MPIVPADELTSIYFALARHFDATDEEARVFAACLLRADLRDHSQQGIGLLSYLRTALASGEMRFGVPIKRIREGPAFALVETPRAVGQVVGTECMTIAREKARHVGVGWVCSRGIVDIAMASAFALQAADDGMIGITMSTGPALVAPWGGRDPVLCTNPIAVAAPGRHRPVIVIDMATSAFSLGQALSTAREGSQLAAIGVVYPGGEYGDDPRRILTDPTARDSQVNGALLPLGHKGFGWMLIIELLAGALAGTSPARGATASLGFGQVFAAIDIRSFGPEDAFHDHIERLVQALKKSRPAAGFAEIRIPGEHANSEEGRRTRSGVPVLPEDWSKASSIVDELDLRKYSVEP